MVGVACGFLLYRTAFRRSFLVLGPHTTRLVLLLPAVVYHVAVGVFVWLFWVSSLFVLFVALACFVAVLLSCLLC